MNCQLQVVHRAAGTFEIPQSPFEANRELSQMPGYQSFPSTDVYSTVFESKQTDCLCCGQPWSDGDVVLEASRDMERGMKFRQQLTPEYPTNFRFFGSSSPSAAALLRVPIPYMAKVETLGTCRIS